jgi:hypothetical protein
MFSEQIFMFEHVDEKFVSRHVGIKNTPIIHDPKLIGFGRLAVYRFPGVVG